MMQKTPGITYKTGILIFCVLVSLLIGGCGSGMDAKRVVALENIARMDLDGEVAKQYYTQRYINEHPERFEDISRGYSSLGIPVPPEERPSISQIMEKHECTVRGNTACVRM